MGIYFSKLHLINFIVDIAVCKHSVPTLNQCARVEVDAEDGEELEVTTIRIGEDNETD